MPAAKLGMKPYDALQFHVVHYGLAIAHLVFKFLRVSILPAVRYGWPQGVLRGERRQEEGVDENNRWECLNEAVDLKGVRLTYMFVCSVETEVCHV